MDTTQDPPVPVPIKFGDINQDGFPDLLAIIVTGSGSHRQRMPNLVMSAPCDKGVAGCAGNGSGRRGWRAVKKDADPLLKIQDGRSVALLNMDEDVSQGGLKVKSQLTVVCTYRVLWTSWYSVRGTKERAISSSCRTTFTTMRSS